MICFGQSQWCLFVFLFIKFLLIVRTIYGRQGKNKTARIFLLQHPSRCISTLKPVIFLQNGGRDQLRAPGVSEDPLLRSGGHGGSRVLRSEAHRRSSGWLRPGPRRRFSHAVGSQKYSTRAALYGRKINNAEHQLSFVTYLRTIADDQIEPEAAVRAYHGDLQRLKIQPQRSLAEDLVLTPTAHSYGGTPTPRTIPTQGQTTHDDFGPSGTRLQHDDRGRESRMESGPLGCWAADPRKVCSLK